MLPKAATTQVARQVEGVRTAEEPCHVVRHSRHGVMLRRRQPKTRAWQSDAQNW